jgi:CBS domain containing-hemolysin-like protein
MLSFFVAIVLVLVLLVAVVARKTFASMPVKELKRRAEQGDVEAASLWPAAAYGDSLRTFLWLVIILSGTSSFLLLASNAPPVFGFLAISLLMYVLFAWLPAARPHGIERRVTMLVTPAISWLVAALEPALRRLYNLTHRRAPYSHTGVYVREDLLDFIERQKTQPDNGLSIEELDLAKTALSFGDKKVRSLYVKRKKVQAVDAKADISPVFLNDLHQSGHSRFPVYDGEPDNIIGTLYLNELTAVGSGKGARGKVRTHMKPGAAYLHEDDTLADALHAFYLTKKQLFVVINKFEEYVGIITIEDILHALLGVPGDYGFDQHENRAAVAGKHTKKPPVIDDHIDETVEPSPEPADDAPAES